MAAGKQVNIDIKTKADTSGADKAAKSLENVSNAGSKGMKEAEKASKNTAYSIGNVANQFQDIAVQVESGTNALRIFTQQGPQIASAFGPYGAIGGALVALGAVAYKVFTDTGGHIKTAEEKAQELADALAGVIEIAKDLNKEEIDFAIKSISAATDQAKLLSSAFDQSEKSASDFTTKTIQNLEKVRSAMVELSRLNGNQVDSVDEIKQKEAAASAARQNQANIDIANQNKRAENAKETTDLAAQELVNITQLSAQKQAEIAREDEKLQKLRLQKQELELQKQTFDQLEAAAMRSGGLVGYAVQKYANREGRAANQQNTETVQSQITVSESKVAELEKAIQQNGAISNAVIAAATKLTEATIKQNDVFQSVATEIESIRQSYASEEIKARVSTVGQEAQAVSTEIKGLLDSIQPTTDAQKATLEGLKSATSDNQILANETLATTANLNALARTLPAYETQKQDTINALLQKVQQLQNDLNATNNQVNRLTQQKTIPLQTR